MDLGKLEEERRHRRQASNGAHSAGGQERSQKQQQQQWKEGDRSLLLATAIYLFGGGHLGLHHLYLDRPLQAFLWACSVGGFGGWGLVRDLFRLQHYAGVRNASPQCEERLATDMKYSKVPPWSFSRLLGCYAFGKWFGTVAWVAGPEVFPSAYFVATSALGEALGIWLAGSACTHQGGSLWWTSLATLAATVVPTGYSLLAGLLAFQWTRCWEPEATKRRPRRWQLVVAVLVFWTVALGGFIEHGSITLNSPSDGAQPDGHPETYKVKDCIWNVLRGIDFQDMYHTFKTGSSSEDDNWGSFWQDRWDAIKGSLDVSGEKRALKTLGMDAFLGKAYTEDDVKQHFKRMAKQWHPDKVGPDKREEAEKRMQQINEAKEILDGRAGHRKKRR